MLIAFTSIILGLSVTFYFYCSRGMQDSQVAIRIAQRRLAFQGAINAIYAIPDSNDLSAFTAGTTVDLEEATIARTKRLGWYRLRKADAAYMSANAAKFPGLVASNCLFVTAGTGPSNGDPSWDNPDAWRYELRRWYVVELEAASAPAIPKRIWPIFPAPPGVW